MINSSATVHERKKIHLYAWTGHCFKTNLQGFHSWTKICMVMLYCVISVVCLCCPILILPSFLLANRWNAPACQYMLKKPFTRAWLQIVLSSPLGFYFHSPAELTMYALLFISSTYRKNKMPVGLHFRVSPLILASSDTLPPLSTHLHPSVLWVSLFYPDCTTLAKSVHTKCDYLEMYSSLGWL